MTVNPLVDDTGYGAVTKATANDPDVAKMRYRNRIIIVESTMNTTELAQQAIDWEMNRRYGRSKVLQVTIDNWRDSAGKLWEPNTLIPVNIPKMGINDVLWLLAEVTFIKDDQGTVAQMVLMPPAAFSVQPYRFYNVIQELNR